MDSTIRIYFYDIIEKEEFREVAEIEPHVDKLKNYDLSIDKSYFVDQYGKTYKPLYACQGGIGYALEDYVLNNTIYYGRHIDDDIIVMCVASDVLVESYEVGHDISDVRIAVADKIKELRDTNFDDNQDKYIYYGDSSETEFYDIGINNGIMPESFFTYGSTNSPSCSITITPNGMIQSGKYIRIEFLIENVVWQDFGVFYIEEQPTYTSEQMVIRGIGLLQYSESLSAPNPQDITSEWNRLTVGNIFEKFNTDEYAYYNYLEFTSNLLRGDIKTNIDNAEFILPYQYEDNTFSITMEDAVKECVRGADFATVRYWLVRIYEEREISEKTEEERLRELSKNTGYMYDWVVYMYTTCVQYTRNGQEFNSFCPSYYDMSLREYLSHLAMSLHCNVNERNGVLHFDYVDCDSYSILAKSKPFTEDSYEEGIEEKTTSYFRAYPVDVNVKQVNLLQAYKRNGDKWFAFPGVVEKEHSISIIDNKGDEQAIDYGVTIDSEPTWLDIIDISSSWGIKNNIYLALKSEGKDKAFYYYPINNSNFCGWNPLIYAGGFIKMEINGITRYVYIGNTSLNWDGGTTISINTPCDVKMSGNTSSNSTGTGVSSQTKDVQIPAGIADGIMTGKIFRNGSISGSKIEDSTIDGSKIKFSSFEDGAISGTAIDTSTFKDGSISGSSFVDGTIENSKIKDSTLTGAKIADATIGFEKVNTSFIEDLTADKVYIEKLSAEVAKLGYLSAESAEIGYAKIDFSNVGTQVVSSSMIIDGAVTNEKVANLSANKITSGTIDASKITVTNLNADNLTVGTINGKLIGNGSVDLDKLAEEVPTKEYLDNVQKELQGQIDGAIETFTKSEIPTLNNEPAILWTDNETRKKHIGDVCYVLNPASSADGYCYRFANTGTEASPSYKWVLIKDSDVTKALKDIIDINGEITGIKQFDTEISSWKNDTDTELSSLKLRTTTLETDMGSKVESSVFNELKQTVDENSASIMSLSDTVSKKADGSTVETLKNTVNEVKQTANSNSLSISGMQTEIGKKADGSTVTELSTRTSKLEQNLDGFKTEVSKTYTTKTEFDNLEIKLTTNLLKTTLATTTKNGITLTNNGDGTYTVNGTATAETLFSYFTEYPSVSEKIKLVCCPSGGSLSTYFCTIIRSSDWSLNCADIGNGVILSDDYEQGDKIRFSIIVESGTVCDNLVFKPMLTTNLNATYDDFVPYTGSTGSLNYDLANNHKLTETVKTIAEQTADKFSWLVKSGTSATDFTLTDRVASLLSKQFNIDALTTFKNSAENGTSTVINGGAIKAKTIKADSIDVDNLFAQDIIATGTITGATLEGSIIHSKSKRIIDGNSYIESVDIRGYTIRLISEYYGTEAIISGAQFSYIDTSTAKEYFSLTEGENDEIQLKIMGTAVNSTGKATTGGYGLTKLTSSLTSTSTSLAATPYAVKQLNDKRTYKCLYISSPKTATSISSIVQGDYNEMIVEVETFQGDLWAAYQVSVPIDAVSSLTSYKSWLSGYSAGTTYYGLAEIRIKKDYMYLNQVYRGGVNLTNDSNTRMRVYYC